MSRRFPRARAELHDGAAEAELLALVDGVFTTPGTEEPRYESFTPLG